MAFYEDAMKKRNHVRNTRNEEWEEEKSQHRNGRESRREDRNMRTAGRTGSRNAKPAGSRLLRKEERDERRQFGMNPRQRREDFAPKSPDGRILNTGLRIPGKTIMLRPKPKSRKTFSAGAIRSVKRCGAAGILKKSWCRREN